MQGAGCRAPVHGAVGDAVDHGSEHRPAPSLVYPQHTGGAPARLDQGLTPRLGLRQRQRPRLHSKAQTMIKARAQTEAQHVAT